MKSNYKTVVLSAILHALIQPLVAQIDESDTMKLQLQIALTGNYQKGNLDLLTILSRSEFFVKPLDDWAFKTQNSSFLTRFSGSTADNNIFSRNTIYYKPESRVFGYVSAFVSTNFRRKIDVRYFILAGPTWQAIRTKSMVLKLSANVVVESTIFSDNVFNESSYNGQDKINLWRSTVYLGGWAFLLDNRLRINYEFYWQPAYNNRSNYRTQFEVGFSYPFSKGFSFNTVYIFSHENVVVENIKEDDQVLTFGLSYLLTKN